MDKNKMIGVVVVVALVGLFFWWRSGGEEAPATDACAGLDNATCDTTAGCTWAGAVDDDPATTDVDETAAEGCAAE